MFDVVIVGGGPRAVATVLRLVAREPERVVQVAVIDAIDVGAGATWRVDQPAAFLNNTTSGATTIHADASTPMSGPVGYPQVAGTGDALPGNGHALSEAGAPSPLSGTHGDDLVQWAQQIVQAGHHRIPWVYEEALQITPESFPTRRIQGVYFREQLDAAEATGLVRITRILGTAVDLVLPSADAALPDDHPGTAGEHTAAGVVMSRSEVTGGSPGDSSGTQTVWGRTVVLAQGMVQGLPSDQVQHFTQAAAAHSHLMYISPGMPAEKNWDQVPSGEPVIVRGLGANFFDVAGHLSVGRGGRFVPVEGDPHGRLRYELSGAEPLLVAGSGRGMPYRSKPDGHLPVPTFTPRFATAEWLASLTTRPAESISFIDQVWPVVAQELAWAHIRALSTWKPEALQLSLEDAAEHLTAAEDLAGVDAVLDAVHHPVHGAEFAFRVDHLRRPTSGEPVSSELWDRMVQWHIDHELQSMTHPGEHPRSAVNLAMSSLRGPISALDRAGVLEAGSAVQDLAGWFTADGLFLASGPPASRTREVLALMEAGIITLLGPQMRVGLSDEGPDGLPGFTAMSPITGRRLTSRVLMETRMSKGKVPTTRDPLLRSLLDSGRGRIHQRIAADGTPVATESIEATTTGHHLVSTDSRVDPRVVILGIPAESTQRGSAIGASPGKPSPLLAGADVAAKQVLERMQMSPRTQGEDHLLRQCQ